MRIDLDADAHAPAAARRFVAAALNDHDGREAAVDLDDLTLVVSELVTNAVRAGAQQIGVELTLRNGGVELRVADDAAGWPTLRNPDWAESEGRGLAIVEKLSDRWQATPLRQGKRISVTWSRTGADVGS